MKKKWISVLLCLCMAVSMLPAPAMAAETHQHPYCRDAGCTVDHDFDGRANDHSNIPFSEPWTSTNSLPIETGNYYLTENITLNTVQGIRNDNKVSICLNGHTIDLNGKSFWLGERVELTITDCQVGGTIKNGCNDQGSSDDDCAIRIKHSESSFIMYAGKITESKRGVYVENGKFHMFGGEITGNGEKDGSTIAQGGGVCLVNSSAQMTLSGKAAIYGNTATDGKDVYVGDYRSKITIASPLENRADAAKATAIGVDRFDREFTSGWEKYMHGKTKSNYFKSSSASQYLIGDGEELIITSDSQKTQEATPTVTFNATGYSRGVLSGMTQNYRYSNYMGGTWTYAQDYTTGAATVTGLRPDYGLWIKYVGSSNTTASVAQKFTLTRQTAPEGLTVTQPTIASGGKGSINTTAAHEYCKLASGIPADDAYTPCSGEMTDLEPGRYCIRTKGAGTALASEYVAYTVNAYSPDKAATPTAAFTATGYDTGKLTGVADGMKYRIGNSGNWTDITSNSDVNITGLTGGSYTISVVRKGDGVNNVDSDPKTISVTRGATPASLGFTHPTTEEGTDGKITGTTTDMEYSTDATFANSTACTATNTTVPAPGTYYVRTKAAGTALASEAATVKVYDLYEIRFELPGDVTSYEYVIPTETAGYASAGSASIEVGNMGNAATGALTITATGNTDAFTFSRTIGAALVQSSSSFFVRPVAGLAAGTYEISLTAATAYGTQTQETVSVKFTVEPAAPAPYNPPASTSSDSAPTYRLESSLPGETGSSGGSVTFSSSTAKKGETVTFTVTPGAHYQVADVIVRDVNGEEVEVKKNEDGTYSFKMPTGKVTVEPVFVWDNPFTDVRNNSYCAPAVEWALNRGIAGGTSETTFEPSESCTRAQMAVLLWRAAGCPEPLDGANPFTDVADDSYYAKAVQWAYEQGIAGGTGATTFSPDRPCTRAQMVTFLHRLAGKQAAAGSANPFADVLNAYYTEAVQWAYEQGIAGGTSATTFSPQAICNRGQMVVFLYRYFTR